MEVSRTPCPHSTAECGRPARDQDREGRECQAQGRDRRREHMREHGSLRIQNSGKTLHVAVMPLLVVVACNVFDWGVDPVTRPPRSQHHLPYTTRPALLPDLVTISTLFPTILVPNGGTPCRGTLADLASTLKSA